MKNKKMLCVLISIGVILVSLILSILFESIALKIRAVGILISCLVLWISEAVPMFVSTLIMICILPLFNLMPFNEALSNFGLSTALFIMATSAITVVIAESNIPNNIVLKVLKKYKSKPKRFLFVIGLVITIFSGFVSSLATCVLFYSLFSSFFKKNDIKKESNFARDIMMIIPACSGIGGFISPAGTPANLLVIDILKQYGINITFFKWFCIGFPIAIITTLVFILSVILLYKPETINIKNKIKNIKFNKNDKIIASIMLCTIVCWLVSGFFDVSTTLIAIIAMGIMFMPKVELLDTKKFASQVNWDLVLSMGSVSVVMVAISNTNIFIDIVNSVFNNIVTFPLILALFIISLCTCLIRTFIPTTTAVIALLAPILINISLKINLNIMVLLLLASYWAASALLFVYTEPIYMITYKDKHYKAIDLFKVGIAPTLILALIIPCLLNYFVK